MTTLETLTLATRHGISSACLHPLLVLVDDSPLTPTVLAERSMTTPSNISGLLKRLEHKGWVVSERHPHDRRKQLVTPTPLAYELFAPAMEEMPDTAVPQ